MRTSTKVILAAMGVAALASPVMAQTWPDVNVPVSTDNVFWGLAYAPLYGSAYGAYGAHGAYGAYGSAAPVRPGLLAPGVVEAPLPRILDCVHVPFPQCSGGN
jgi:hypothetical protein